MSARGCWWAWRPCAAAAGSAPAAPAAAVTLGGARESGGRFGRHHRHNWELAAEGFEGDAASGRTYRRERVCTTCGQRASHRLSEAEARALLRDRGAVEPQAASQCGAHGSGAATPMVGGGRPSARAP